MKVKGGFRDPERVSLSPEYRSFFNKEVTDKDYVDVFPEPNLCPLNRGVPKGRFHCKYLNQ